MTATVMTANLKPALSLVARAVSKRATLPVLANVRISVTGGYLELQGTDLEFGLRTLVPADYDDLEPVTVNARDMLGFVKSAPKGSLITFGPESSEATGLRLSSPVSSVVLPAIGAEEYPVIPFTSEHPARFGIVDGPTFARACKRAYLTASHDEVRPILTGALLRFTVSGLVVVSADNYRISETVVPWLTEPDSAQYRNADDASGPFSAVVPARALKEWATIKTDRVSVDVHPNSDRLILTAGDTAMVTRTIDGQFPRYESVMPVKHDTASTIAVKPVSDALAAILPTAKLSSNVVRVSVNGRWELAATDGRGGSAESAVDVVSSGDDLTIALNGSYLKDALSSLGEEANVYFAGHLAPVLFTSRDSADEYRTLVMPVRLPA